MPKSSNLIFGSAFHDAVEEYIRDNDKPRPVSDIFEDTWQKQLEENQSISWYKKDTAESLEALGAKMAGDEIQVTGGGPNRKARNLSVFLNDVLPMIDDRGPVVERRVELQVPGVPVPIIGYIDMIASDGVPVDFKTAARKWYADKAHSELQPAFYLASLLQSGTPSPDGRFRYIVFTKTKSPVVQIIETKRTVAQLFWTMDLAREVWEAIQAGAFPPQPMLWKHSPDYCEYWDICQG